MEGGTYCYFIEGTSTSKTGLLEDAGDEQELEADSNGELEREGSNAAHRP